MTGYTIATQDEAGKTTVIAQVEKIELPDYTAQATARAEAREYAQRNVEAAQSWLATAIEEGTDPAPYKAKLAEAERKLTTAQYLEQC